MMKTMEPAAVVDHAFSLAERDELTVHTIGTYASWNPTLLCRAHNELVNRHNMIIDYGLSPEDRNLYRGILNALSKAHDNALRGPRHLSLRPRSARPRRRPGARLA